MKKHPKTNATRLLDKAGISYRLNGYEPDPEDLSAVHVARQIGVDTGSLFKTLVARGDRNGIFVCVIPGDRELDLKKTAIVSSNKKAEPITVKELLPLTGYIRGGCSPIGMKKQYPTYIDKGIYSYSSVFISAGIRGLQIGISPGDLVRFLGAEVSDLVTGPAAKDDVETGG